jgi:hypothetical protein
MKIVKRVIVAAGIAAALALIPAQTGAYWFGPGLGPWRHAYVHDPAYRWGSPWTRNYIRDLHLYGPTYASWNQRRRYGRGWW